MPEIYREDLFKPMTEFDVTVYFAHSVMIRSIYNQIDKMRKTTLLKRIKDGKRV